MLYILLFVFLCFIIGAAIIEGNSRYPSETAEALGGISMFFFAVTLLVTVIAGVRYNTIKSTATAQLEVLNSQNEIVLAQIEPLVQQALNYESNTYKELNYLPDNKRGRDIGWLYLHNDGKDWCASYGREGNFVCLNPDAEKPPYNNAVAYGKTANEALQGLYDWCVENGFIK